MATPRGAKTAAPPKTGAPRKAGAPRKTGRGAGPPRRFTADEVLDAALRVLEREGEAFTMRDLADELGTGPMTLYGYFANKGELLEGLAGRVFQSAGADVDPAASWQDQVREMVREIHHAARRHPYLATIFRSQSAMSPNLFRARERLLRMLVGAGFEGPLLIRALGVIGVVAQGYAAIASATDDPMFTPQRIRQLPPADFPMLHHYVDSYDEHTSDDAFEYALDLVLGALTEELERTRTAGAGE